MRAKKIIFIAIVLLAAGQAASQEASRFETTVPGLSSSHDGSTAYGDGLRLVDEPRILDARFDSIVRDPVEYRKVLDKFSAAQVRLSVGDCAIAYYGFPMQPGFTPIVTGEEDMQRAIMAEDYATAYALGMQILETAPVNLTALYWTLYAATETRQPWEVRNSLRGRYNSICHIISISGDGISPETAFKVVWTSDMYSYTMLELGLEIGEGYLWDNRWTEFEVTPAGPGTTFKNSSIFFEVWKRE